MKDIKLACFLRCAEAQLTAAGIPDPAPDARILTAHALQLDRAEMLAQANRMLTDEEICRAGVLIERRTKREPVDRIMGEREFWSLPFGLNEATLTPRPDSETLIETALRLFHPGASRDPDTLSARSGGEDAWAPACAGVVSNFRILDLGTGSGCLLLALLQELPNASGIGVDKAERAVEQARRNAGQLGLSARAEFLTNNWADGIEEKFDLVISNPPYIARGEIAELMPEVREHDPLAALDGGEDGLDAYRLLISQLPRLLKPKGRAVFEIGIGQGDAVRELFAKAGFGETETQKDLGGIERCVSAQLPER